MNAHFVAITNVAALSAVWAWSYVRPVLLFNHDPN